MLLPFHLTIYANTIYWRPKTTGAAAASKAAIELQKNGGAVKPTDDTKKVDWNGDVVPDGPWYDHKLFSIGDFKVTGKTAAIGSGTIIAIAFVSCGICSFISYRKRKTIAIHARRLSSVATRAS